MNLISFAEFYAGKGGDMHAAWLKYYTYGGLPLILSLDTGQKKVRYLRDLFDWPTGNMTF